MTAPEKQVQYSTPSTSLSTKLLRDLSCHLGTKASGWGFLRSEVILKIVLVLYLTALELKAPLITQLSPGLLHERAAEWLLEKSFHKHFQRQIRFYHFPDED